MRPRSTRALYRRCRHAGSAFRRHERRLGSAGPRAGRPPGGV